MKKTNRFHDSQNNIYPKNLPSILPSHCLSWELAPASPSTAGQAPGTGEYLRRTPLAHSTWTAPSPAWVRTVWKVELRPPLVRRHSVWWTRPAPRKTPYKGWTWGTTIWCAVFRYQFECIPGCTRGLPYRWMPPSMARGAEPYRRWRAWLGWPPVVHPTAVRLSGEECWLEAGAAGRMGCSEIVPRSDEAFRCEHLCLTMWARAGWWRIHPLCRSLELRTGRALIINGFQRLNEWFKVPLLRIVFEAMNYDYD